MGRSSGPAGPPASGRRGPHIRVNPAVEGIFRGGQLRVQEFRVEGNDEGRGTRGELRMKGSSLDPRRSSVLGARGCVGQEAEAANRRGGEGARGTVREQGVRGKVGEGTNL